MCDFQNRISAQLEFDLKFTVTIKVTVQFETEGNGQNELFIWIDQR